MLAISSVVALVIAARTSPQHTTSIAAIHPAMNFAYVQVRGAVVAHPTIEDDYISFRLRDDEGELRVSAYRRVARALLETRRVPMAGDLVSVNGTLRIREGEPSLTLNVAEDLHIETPSPVPLSLDALQQAPLGERVRVVGQVRRIRDVSGRLRILTLRAEQSTADVVIALAHPLLGQLDEIGLGSWIAASGGVGEFRDQKQLLVSRAADITPTQPNPATRAIASLSRRSAGQWVAVSGTVSDLEPFSSGMRVSIRDASGESLPVVFFDALWDTLPFSLTLQVGDPLSAQGTLNLYRGRLELMPEMREDVWQ